MKIAFIIIAIAILAILAVIITGLVKDHLDEKARKAEYQKMLTRQKREAEWKSDIRTSRSTTTTNFASGGKITPAAKATKSGRPVKRNEDDTYVVADSGDSFDGIWLDPAYNNGQITDWTSTNDNKSNWGSSEPSYTPDPSPSTSYDSGSTSSSSDSSSGSYDSGSSSSSYDSGSSSSSYDSGTSSSGSDY
jgi:hypothetical protein